MELPVQDCCSALETAIRKAALPTQDNYTAIVLHYYGEKGKWNVGAVRRDLLLPDILGKCA